MQISCTTYSNGVVHEKMVRPSYLTTTPLSEPKETWSHYKKPFIIDTKGYIIYLDDHPKLWEELEGHLEKLPTPKDHASTDNKNNNIPSRIAKIKQCTNEKVISFLNHQCVLHFLCIKFF